VVALRAAGHKVPTAEAQSATLDELVELQFGRVVCSARPTDKQVEERAERRDVTSMLIQRKLAQCWTDGHIR
jgi:hypothetical protein